MSDWITFEENKPITVELKDTDVEKKDNNFGGYQYDWNIIPLDTGEIKFSATQSLCDKMIALKVSAGDSISIEKVKRPEVFNGKPFFKVEVASKQPIPAMSPSDKAVMDKHAIGEIRPVAASPIGAGFAQKDDKMVLHENNIRIEALEKDVVELKRLVAELMKDALPF